MDGSRLVGKVNPLHGVCYLPHEGQEVAVSSYSTLVLAATTSTTSTTEEPVSVEHFGMEDATVTPAFLSPTSARPRTATPLLVTSAIAKLFADFATFRPASQPISQTNPLEGETSS